MRQSINNNFFNKIFEIFPKVLSTESFNEESPNSVSRKLFIWKNRCVGIRKPAHNKKGLQKKKYKDY